MEENVEHVKNIEILWINCILFLKKKETVWKEKSDREFRMVCINATKHTFDRQRGYPLAENEAKRWIMWINLCISEKTTGFIHNSAVEKWNVQWIKS